MTGNWRGILSWIFFGAIVTAAGFCIMGKNGWAGREGGTSSGNTKKDQMEAGHSLRSENITLFLAGDVMTGRGIDQVVSGHRIPNLSAIRLAYV